MKNTMKKTLSVILSVVLVLANISLITFATTESTTEYTTSANIVGYSAALVERKDLSRVAGVDQYYLDEEGEIKEFKISTVADLKLFGEIVAAGQTFAGLTIYLAADIDLSNEENFAPIGGWPTAAWTFPAFCGTFDGQGYIIKGMKLTLPEENEAPGYGGFGFFRRLGAGAVVKNLVFDENCVVSVHSKHTKIGTMGMLAGVIDSNQSAQTTSEHTVTIFNVFTQGKVIHGGGVAGGISAMAKAAWVTIDHCTNAADLEVMDGGTSNRCNDRGVGGLLGMVGEGVTTKASNPNKIIPVSVTITNSRNTGDIEGGMAPTGGIVGHMTPAARQEGLVGSDGTVHQASNETKHLTIDNCINNGNVTYTTIGTNKLGIAGIVGLNQGNANQHVLTIKNSKTYATITDPTASIDPTATSPAAPVSQIVNDGAIDNIKAAILENTTDEAGNTDATLAEALWQHLVAIATPEPAPAPGGDTPSGDTPSGDTPSGDTPSGDTPSGDASNNDTTTEAPTTQAPTTTEEKKSGCGATVALIPVMMVTLGAAVVAIKKREA